MEPTYGFGDIILINRLSYLFHKPKAGDVIALKNPKNKKHIIKRIQKIQNGKYFVVGDNKKESTDSREFGLISKNEIIGKVC